MPDPFKNYKNLLVDENIHLREDERLFEGEEEDQMTSGSENRIVAPSLQPLKSPRQTSTIKK